MAESDREQRAEGQAGILSSDGAHGAIRNGRAAEISHSLPAGSGGGDLGSGQDGGGGGDKGGTGGGAGDDGDGIGHVQDLRIETELQDSYLTYAMSTIMDRALPDVRDGLKPSQRRILVAMNDLNLRPSRKHMKCAKIAGQTSGDYHPHGESVIYPTLVNMAQRWRMRCPLVDPQGNFGSIDGDPPAAMRYTEARLTMNSLEMLEDLKLDTVEFQPNYDDRLMEPTVLPAKFPNLIVNGGIGIAVGMATSLAPHNAIEVLDSIIRVLDHPDIPLQELMEDQVKDGQVVRRGIKGPDFPTGATILGRRGIVEAYATGRGKITIRGTTHTEDIKGQGGGKESGRIQIVIDEIPYGQVQNSLMEKIVEAVKEERIEGVSDVRNESGREAQSRIVIELKRGAEPAVVENQLYQFTPLQQTFSIHNLALVNRQPRTLSLKEMISHYIEHRVDVIRRRTTHLMREAKKRAHVLEGMILAVCDIDEVIRLIRSSQTRQEAIDKLMERGFRIAGDHKHAASIPERLMAQVRTAGERGLWLTRIQAETIGGMRLIQLVGLEIERLVAEYRDIAERIEDYEDILARRTRVIGMIRDDCEGMRARLLSEKAISGKTVGAARLTRIEDAEGDINIEALIQEEDVAVTVSRAGYAKRVALSNYRQQGRGGKGIIASTTRDEDTIEHMFVAGTHDDLLCFTNTGRVFKMKVFELPDLPRQSKGRPLINLIEMREGERVKALLPVRNFEEGSQFLTFVSKGGIVKRTPLKDYRNVNKSGLIAVGLKDGDEVFDVTLTNGNDDLLLATTQGMAIRFNEDDVRIMGRAAAGVKGIELPDDAAVIGVVEIPMIKDADGDPVTRDPNIALLTICQNGFGKRTLVDEYRVQPESGKAYSQSRGGKGRADINTSERNGSAVAALGVRESDDVVVVTRAGMLVRMPAAEIRLCGRAAQGVRIVKLDEGDSVVAAARVEDDGSSKEPPSDASPVQDGK